MLPYLAKAPRLFKALTGNALSRALMKTLGLVCLPELSGTSVVNSRAAKGVGVATVAALSSLDDLGR